MDIKRTFVTGVIIERRKRTKKIDYKGRGKSGMRKRDFCTFKLILEEKPWDQFLLEMIRGKNPVMIQSLLKEYLKETNSNFETLLHFQMLLNTNGAY